MRPRTNTGYLTATEWRIELRGGGLAVADAADYAFAGQYTWARFEIPHAERLVYARGRVAGRLTLLHTLLTGWPMVDHINGDGLDNRRANLRQATHSQNMGNRRKLVASASRYKGIYWDRRKWRAQIGYRGSKISLGVFESEESAALAYDEAARSLFGTFAALNFPREGERGALR